MDEATKERLESEYYEQLERFKAEYIELCLMIGAHLDKVAEIEKRLSVLEALIAFYGELEKKGEKKEWKKKLIIVIDVEKKRKARLNKWEMYFWYKWAE